MKNTNHAAIIMKPNVNADISRHHTRLASVSLMVCFIVMTNGFLSICKDTHKPSAKANLFAVLQGRRIQGQAKDRNNLWETDVCEFKIFDAGVHPRRGKSLRPESHFGTQFCVKQRKSKKISYICAELCFGGNGVGRLPDGRFRVLLVFCSNGKLESYNILLRHHHDPHSLCVGVYPERGVDRKEVLRSRYPRARQQECRHHQHACLLYTSDAADD